MAIQRRRTKVPAEVPRYKVTIQLYEDDFIVIDNLHTHTGAKSRSALIRLALRVLLKQLEEEPKRAKNNARKRA